MSRTSFLDILLSRRPASAPPVVARGLWNSAKPLRRPTGPTQIHGCFLFGCDHIDDAEAEENGTSERELLAELGHPDPYACDDEEPPSKRK